MIILLFVKSNKFGAIESRSYFIFTGFDFDAIFGYHLFTVEHRLEFVLTHCNQLRSKRSNAFPVF
jgi:hypothetical protein